MSMSPQMEGRRLKVFRLSDVPENIRLSARVIAERDFCTSPLECVMVGVAADHPSDKVYAVSLEAWEKAMRKRWARPK